MTDVSDAVREDAATPAADPDASTGADGGSGPARRGHGTALLAGLAALVAIVCAVLLPFAPVAVNEPTVSWPRDAARPESTLLSLTAYRPLAVEIRFSCDVVRLAAAGGGVVVSTTLPESPLPLGLAVTAREDRVQVRAQGGVLLDEALPPGPCAYAITGRSTGKPVVVDPALVEAGGTAVAGPDDAELVIDRDGVEVARSSSDRLPDVDALVTSLTAIPADIAGDLSVRLQVDDEFTSSPTPAKQLLIGVLCVALAACAALLWRMDRAVARERPRRTWALPRLVDLAVPAVMVFWMFVAPATDDDGYYAAMSRNAQLSGEVGNYYQLYDQSFTPFTWFYQLLSWWQQLAGDAPVAQRVLALVFGLLTWLLVRRFAIHAMADRVEPGRAARSVCHAVLAVVFLAWWIPQAMGVRPESMVALCAAGALVAVLAAASRRRLLLGWTAFALAGLGFTAHPTGFTLLAPLVAGMPLLWPVVRVEGRRLVTTLRALAVAAGGMTAPLMGFADGALRDFLRGQAIFLSIQGQEGWTSEFLRYVYLFSQIPMGNFAKRAVVCVCIVALVWFGVLMAAAAARRVTVPVPLWFAGSTTALAFAALWLTPSKWTHHFGVLSGVGSVFVALFLVMSVPVLREVLRGARPPIGVVAAVAGSFVVALALAWHGPNSWPYAWLAGVRLPDQPPEVKNVPLDSLAGWLAALAAIAVVLVVIGRFTGERDPRFAVLRAVPVVVVASLVGTVGYTVGAFGLAAAAGTPRESVWAQSLADPLATRCAAGGAVQVLDPATATPLPQAARLPAADPPAGFVAGGGFYPGSLPQGGATSQVWGSLVSVDGDAAERTFGEMSTGWYQLPADLPPGAAVTVLAAGTLAEGNELTATYGRRSDEDVATLDSETLTGPTRSPVWRTLVLTPPTGADVVRLDAVDASGFVHGWLAFTAPAVQRSESLARFVPAGAPVALAWQLAFNYPCLRQAGVVDGITEAPAYGVLWGENLSGLNDIAWQPHRGGVFGQVPRSQSVQELATVQLPGPPKDPYVQVYVFDTDLARSAYTLTETSRTTGGASVVTGTGPDTPG